MRLFFCVQKTLSGLAGMQMEGMVSTFRRLFRGIQQVRKGSGKGQEDTRISPGKQGAERHHRSPMSDTNFSSRNELLSGGENILKKVEIYFLSSNSVLIFAL
jgi:hypothetical protein